MRNEQLYHWVLSGFSLDPDKTAIKEYNGKTITYLELQNACDRISESIRLYAGKSAEPIGVFGGKCIDAVSTLLSILHSGNAYVPLDPEAPQGRIATILKQSHIRILLAEKKLMQNHPEFKEVRELQNGWSLYFNSDPAIQHDLPDHTAYVLFTSGSTGIPKGVVVSHKAAIAFLNWGIDTFRPGAGDVFSSVAPLHFDLSVFDLFVSLRSGSTLLLFQSDHIRKPEFLSMAIQNEKISYWYSTPTVLRLILEFGHPEEYDFSSLRHCLFAGEVFPPREFRLLQGQMPDCVFSNLYGPTETNVCTFYTIQQKEWDVTAPLPIGKVTSQYLHRIDSDGVLLISGKSLMTGYYGDDLRTKERMKIIDGQCWYYTGDLVREENGLLFYQGRIDRMIKRRGYRIELDEIEFALLSVKSIREAAAIEVFSGNEKNEIIGFYTGNSDVKTIRDQLILILPLYMLPDKIVNLESLPKTSTHKTDYTALKKWYAETHS